MRTMGPREQQLYSRWHEQRAALETERRRALETLMAEQNDLLTRVTCEGRKATDAERERFAELDRERGRVDREYRYQIEGLGVSRDAAQRARLADDVDAGRVTFGDCPRCNGTGDYHGHGACFRCGGSGWTS